MIIQFKGESRKQAIVNHFSLDIEEEKRFFDYVKDMGYNVEDDDCPIESLHNMWQDKMNSHD